jgi:hypothetical protein
VIRTACFLALAITMLLTLAALGQTDLTIDSTQHNFDLSTISVRSPFGFEYPSTYFNQPPRVTVVNSYEGILITGVPTNPPLLGHFDQKGKVVNGDYALVLYVDLDTAPITKLWFSGLWPTVDQPVIAGIPSIKDGESLQEYEFALGATNLATQIRGTEGTIRIGIALLDKANQSLETAWGATFTQTIRINDAVGQYGNYIFTDGVVQHNTAAFSKGGAAYFKHASKPR